MRIFSRKLTFWPFHYVNWNRFFPRHLPALISDRNQTRSEIVNELFHPLYTEKWLTPYRIKLITLSPVEWTNQYSPVYLFNLKTNDSTRFLSRKTVIISPHTETSLFRPYDVIRASRKFQIPFRNKLAVRHTCCRRRRQRRSFVCAINTPRNGGWWRRGELEKCYFSSKTM